MVAKVARMFTANTAEPAGNKPPAGDAAPKVPLSRNAGIPDDIGQIIAQVPDVDAKTPRATIAFPLDGRIIGQALSMKMVFGLGIGLVIGALLPFVFGKGSSSKPVKELPTWNARTADLASGTEQTLAPKWQPGPPVAAQAATVGIAPPLPPADGYRPAAMGAPAWSRPQPPASGSLAVPPATPRPTSNLGPDYAAGNAPRGVVGTYGPIPNRREWQADRRNDVATPYGNPPGYGSRGNPADTPAVGSASGYAPPPDDRYRNPADPGPAPQNSPQNGQQYGMQYGQPIPPNGYGAGPDYRYQQNNDPGVARFDGTITAPPARTNP